MSLISLIYVSYASHTMSDNELKDVLQKARTKNASLNITGMLLHRDGFFIQALEGEESVVMPLFDVIKRDPRHCGVLVVYKNHITERSFSDWKMGFNPLRDEDVKQVEGYLTISDADQADFFAANPDRAHRLLNNFKSRTYY